MNKPIVLLVGVAAVTVTGFLDFITGYEVRLFPLYFIPIAFVAWSLSRVGAIGISAASAVAWGLSNWLAGREYASPFTWPINLLSQMVAFSVVGVLVADLRRRLIAEQRLSRHDPLTGLANSRAFYERGEILLAGTRRSARPITLAYLDLDNFKDVNDKFGHPQGDRALAEAAGVLKDQFRASDLVARIGGDEFAILLPDTGHDAAQASLERVRELVAAAMRRNGWPITVSVGAISYAHAPGSLEEAVHGADSLMYRAKGAGKNRVHIEIAEPEGGFVRRAAPDPAQ